MTIFAVDENNDIFLGSNNLIKTIDGADSVLQQCEHSMKTFRGELIFAKNKGIDYLSNVLTGSPNLLLFESQARNLIQNISGVVSIPSFEYSVNDGTLSYSIEIQSNFGSGEINGNI